MRVRAGLPAVVTALLNSGVWGGRDEEDGQTLLKHDLLSEVLRVEGLCVGAGKA